MIFVLMGAPGAGKGTQADLLVAKSGFRKVSTGDALRRQVKEGTELGKNARAFMDQGKLVPDDVLLEILKAELGEDKNEKILLDGYPRNLEQAKTLKSFSERNPIKGVVYLDVDPSLLLSRICGRRTCSNCASTFHVTNNPPKVEGICDNCQAELVQRPDDTEEKVAVRLEIFRQQTLPVIDFYREEGIYQHVDGTGDTNAVFERVLKTLEAFID